MPLWGQARTEAYFGHSGIFYTETKTLFGAFAVGDYGANASTRGPHSLPKYLEANGERRDIAGIWVAFLSRCQRNRCGQASSTTTTGERLIPILMTRPHP